MTTGGQNQVWPVGAPGEAYSAISGTGINVTFTDDFEADLGWTVETTASDGPWERGVPIPNSVCDRGNPGVDADGSGQCYVTDNSSADNCNSDVDNGSTILTSPVMDATASGAFISYWRWFSNDAGSNPFQDIFVVEVSDDAGATWVELETVGPGGSEVGGGWFQKAFPVASFVDPTDQFQIRFIASDTDPQSVVEAGVDGVELLSVECGEVLGDLDGDGIVGINDFLILLGAWGPCPDPCPPYCVGDLDEDCDVGINDFLMLLGEWTT
jgi:hypothetical protein